MKDPNIHITRRNALSKIALGTTAFSIVPRHVLGGVGYIAPSDKVNIAIIGVGGRGRHNIEDLMELSDVQIPAIADPAPYWDLANFYYRFEAGRGPVKKVLEDHYGQANPNYTVAEYEDFRVMLEQEKDLDGVLCATPDHTHAYICIQSLSAGMPVYCEKPLTHNIWEARKVAETARITGLATQMGNQQHSSPGVRQTVEYLRSGVLGNVDQVHAWVPATRWTAGLQGHPKDIGVKPEGLNWDLWIGPRAKRDFHQVYAPVTWRDFWDFGCGAMGDFGCHDLDAAVWGLDLPLPDTIEMFPAGFSNEEVAPYGEIGYFHFPAMGARGPLNLTWYSGGLQPPHPPLLDREQSLPRRGAIFQGDQGIMIYQGGNEPPILLPEELKSQVENRRPTLDPTAGHHREWVDAIKEGGTGGSDFQYGAHLTEITLLGVLSLRLGSAKIYWDGAAMKATGSPEADAFIKEPVREGWEMS